MPLRNIKGIVEYDGTEFEGFQIQPEGHRTVQGEITRVLEEILGHPVKAIGASRTDAGVHATGQVIAFKTSASRTLNEILYGSTRRSTVDWRLTELAEVSWEFHPRHDAKSKTYVYFVDTTDSVLRRRFCWGISEELDFPEMNQVLSIFCGEHDFKSFTTSSAHPGEVTVRRIDQATIVRSGELLKFTITGSGFLYQMVRRIVKAVVSVGLGEMKAEEIEGLIQEPEFDRIGTAAPARGLILKQVHY